MKPIWQVVRTHGVIGNYSILLERSGYNGQYYGTINLWDDHKGDTAIYGVHGKTLEDAMENFERAVERYERTKV